jgi:hypothetical protein
LNRARCRQTVTNRYCLDAELILVTRFWLCNSGNEDRLRDRGQHRIGMAAHAPEYPWLSSMLQMRATCLRDVDRADGHRSSLSLWAARQLVCLLQVYSAMNGCARGTFRGAAKQSGTLSQIDG